MKSGLKLSLKIILILAVGFSPTSGISKSDQKPGSPSKPSQTSSSAPAEKWKMTAVFGETEEQKKLEKQLAQKLKAVDSIERQYVMQRNVKIRGQEVPMGHITQFIFRRENSATLNEKQSEAEAKKLTEELRRLAGAPEWFVEKRDQTISFYSDWVKYSRLVRVVYKDLGSRYALSIALSRRGYAVPVFTEAISMQDVFAGKLNSEKTALNFEDRSLWLNFFSVTEAQAQVANGWQNYVNYVRSAGNAVNIQSFETWAAANLGPKIDRGVVAVNGLGTTVGRAGDQLQNFGGTLESSVNKITDPMTALKLGLAGGFGGAIGASLAGPVMSFAIGGIVTLSSGIWHGIMGTLSDEQARKLKSIYGDAYKTFEESARELNAVEGELDKQLLAISLASDHSPEKFLNERTPMDPEHVLRKTASRDLSQVRILNTQMDKVGADQSKGVDCAEYESLNSRSVSFGMNAKLFSSLADSISKFGGDKSQMCQSLQGLLDKWATAESAVYYAKNQMIKSFQAHIMAITSDVEKFNETVGSKRPLDNACLEPIKKLTIARQKTESPNADCLREKTRLIQDSNQYSMNPSQDAIQRCSEIAQLNMIDDLNSFSDFCLQVSTIQGELNHTSYLETAIANAKRNIDIAKGLFRSLSHADCVKGVRLGVCDGSEDGTFTKQQQRYDNMFAAAYQYCPSLKSNKRAVAEDRKLTTGTQDRAPAQEGAAPAGLVTPLDRESRVRPDIQCGFFCRIWNGLTSIFR